MCKIKRVVALRGRRRVDCGIKCAKLRGLEWELKRLGH